MNELKLEVFASDKPVQECSLHIYKLISANLVESSFKIIRGACRKLSNYNAAIGIFENGRQIISTSEIANIPKDLDFELEYQGCQQLDRDGFSNEDSEWYEHYFKVQGIKYSIIEVRKNVGAKVLVENDGDMNPPMGACIFNENKAYLVTTLMKNKKGSPNPLIIEKSCGDISMADAVTQVLYLKQLHVGSTNKLRLPITTGYADKIGKNLDYVPTGQVENKLFFL